MYIEDSILKLKFSVQSEKLIHVWSCFCRWPCTRSYADPVKAFEEDQSISDSSTITETPSSISNGKHPTKKNG